MLKNRISALLALLLLVSFSFFGACEYEFIEPFPVDVPDEELSFSEDIIPIFDSNCNYSGCHVAGFGILDLSPANSYNDLFLKNQIDVDMPAQSALYLKLTESNGTHVDRSTPTQQAFILKWIEEGAKNN